MLKEIYEQPEAIKQTISQALDGNNLRDDFLKDADADFSKLQSVQIIACGTSYHSGMIAKYWFEQLIVCLAKLRLRVNSVIAHQ